MILQGNLFPAEVTNVASNFLNNERSKNSFIGLGDFFSRKYKIC